MSKNEYKAFSGETELPYRWQLSRRELPATGFERAKRVDSFSVWVGSSETQYTKDPTKMMPVTRLICYKVNGSKHKCDARCQSAKGGNCECQCGGKFHGINF